MKTYTWKQGDITRGLDIIHDERLGPVVLIGESGRGRRFEKIKLDRAFPPKIFDGKVLDAEVHEMALPPRGHRPRQSLFSLKKPFGRSSSMILRICTQWTHEPATNGTWKLWQGSAKEKVSGRGAHGEVGQMGHWIDSLIIMGPGDVLRICPEGGSKAQPWALWLDNGQPQTALWANYQAPSQANAEEPAEPLVAKPKPDPAGPSPDEKPGEWASNDAAATALDALRARFGK